MKYAARLMGIIIAAMVIAGCGGASSDATAGLDEGRLISGEIVASDDVSVKAIADASGCIDDVCGVRAESANGEHVEGEVEPATNMWRVRVRAGNWMFAFVDGDGNRLGYLMMNGLIEVAITDGDDVHLGPMRFRNGEMVMDRDMEGLGEGGIFSSCHRDRNRNGMPDDFEELADDYDPAQFEVVRTRPFDGKLDVAPCRPVAISFNMPLNEGTLTSENIVIALGDGTPLAGTIEYVLHDDCDIYTALFMPDEQYPLGATIAVTVASGAEGVLSADGDELLEDIAFSFTVREVDDTLCECYDPDLERQRERVRCEGCAAPCEGCPLPTLSPDGDGA